MGYQLLDDSGAPAKGTYTLLPDDAPKTKPFGQQLNDSIADMPRQLGLTARYGLEGVGGTFDALVGNPLRTLAAPIFGNKPTADTGGTLANLVGLPKPQTSQERVVGDATKMLAGGAVPIAAAGRVAQTATGATKAVADVLAANRAQQLVSAAASGGAGGYVRETGGNEGAQLAASLAAGLAAPAAMNGVQRAGAAVSRGLGNLRAPSPQQAAQIEVTINNALQQSGISMDQLTPGIANGIRNDVTAAYKSGGVLSPDAIRRLADYRLTGATPTAAGLTLDPAIVSQQKNLAKLGINSKDQVAQQLGQTENANNRALISGLNDLGAGSAQDPAGGANRIISALHGVNDAKQGAISSLYDQARDSSGRSAALDHVTFTNKAADLLHADNVESFLTPDIRSKLNDFADAKTPLTVEIAEQFKTGLGRLQRNASDGNTRHALGLVRQALDDTPLIQQSSPAAFGGNQMAAPGALGTASQGAGDAAVDAFGKARAANRQWMQTVESTPALQAIRDGVEPDKFVQDFVVGNGKGASVMSLAQLKNQIKDAPDAMQAVREQIVSHLKSKALNGAADEVGKLSQSSYNKALRDIGDRKLNLFFKPDEINQMKAIGRVASYEQFQPVGSAVNNSNTAGAGGAMLLDRIANSPLLSKIPVLGASVQPAAQNIVIGMKAGQSMNVPLNLATPAARRPLLGPGALSPAAFMLQQDDRNR